MFHNERKLDDPSRDELKQLLNEFADVISTGSRVDANTKVLELGLVSDDFAN